MLAGRPRRVVDEWLLIAENCSQLHNLLSQRYEGPAPLPALSAARAIWEDCRACSSTPYRYEQYELLLTRIDDWCPDDAHKRRWRETVNSNMEAVAAAQRPGSGPEPKTAKGPAKVIDDIIADSVPIRRDFDKIVKFGLAYGASVETLQKLCKEEPMNKTVTTPIKIETKHFVNGVDVTTLTDGEVWQLIANAEASIKGLKEITAQPQSLKDHIAAVEKGIADLVAFVDARNTKAA